MIINKGKPVSLSMRMRTEAAKLPPERSSVTDSGDATLPDIGSSGSKGFNLKLSSTYSLTKSKRDMSRQDMEVERASGIIDYMASGGVFADRTKMTMPNAICVRCGEHASCCMSCTEFLAQEALNFYRKTRARGAASLFANAVTQTGITVVVKYVVFSLWKNGRRQRVWAAKKRSFNADIMYRLHFMRYTFKAWVTFKTKNLVDVRDQRIKELEERVAALDSANALATNLKNNAEAVLARNQREKDGFLATISRQAQEIEALQGALKAERVRVVGLSTLSMPVLSFNKVATQLSENERRDIHRQLFSAAASQQPTYDYNKTFNAEDLATVKEAELKRRSKKKRYKAESLDEEVDLVVMLLNWASTKARDVGSNVDQASGKPLESVLPKHKKVSTFEDFKSGATLLRLVVSLLWDMPQPGHTTLKLAVPDDIAAQEKLKAESQVADTDPPLPSAAPKFDPAKVLDLVKAAQKTPFEMISCAVDLAVTYLALPPFQVGDLVACRPEIYTALLGYLMLASASPAQSVNSLSRVSALITSFERATSNADYARRQIGLHEITQIQQCWAELHGLQQPAIAVAEEVDPVDKPLDSLTAAEGGTTTLLVAAAGPKGVAGAVDPTLLDAGVSAEAMAKYGKLAAAVDKYLSLLGEQDTVQLQFSKKEGPVPGQIGDYAEVMSEVAAVKTQLNDHLLRTDQGYRLATEARLLMSRFQFELYVSELKWTE